MATVLIVDDTAFMRMSIRNIFEKNNYEVIAEAEDGKDAVEKYLKYKPDIITMDITMPKMDGIEAVDKIIAHNKNAKIIMVSAMGQEKIITEAVTKGAKSFIVKPFKEEKVIEVVKKVYES